MADWIVLQVDKAESQNKNIPGNFQECGYDTDMDSHDLLSAVGLYQIPDQIPEIALRAYLDDKRGVAGQTGPDRPIVA